MKRAFSPYALDVAGFVLGIALAVANGWRTADLVWSLWLSSLVLGWTGMAIGLARAVAPPDVPAVVGFSMKAFTLGFLTLHFGIFHFVHSAFLAFLFPVGDGGGREFLSLPYGLVLANYWPWLLVAAIAERGKLTGSDMLVAPLIPVEKRGARRPMPVPGFHPMAAYKNVVRMHLLIFALVPLQLAGIADSWSYVLVYTAYFLPWRVLRPAAA